MTRKQYHCLRGAAWSPEFHAEIEGPIVLLDDVCTSGRHLIGAHRLLHDPNKSPVVLACTFGRSTKEQIEHPVGLHAEEINLGC
jgi:phosphoribosylpyrophosphate synthetase